MKYGGARRCLAQSKIGLVGPRQCNVSPTAGTCLTLPAGDRRSSTMPLGSRAPHWLPFA